jgi:radical SAM superfamily enzyme YgiQ (UPF0313 family)
MTRYVGKIYRPPSEAHSYILQATIGCSWNHCVYCDMYRDKPVFRVRPLQDTLEDIDLAAAHHGDHIDKVFVADGDALVMPMDVWEPILTRLRQRLPRLRQVSAYAMATNIIEKTHDELARLRELGLTLLYIGPESGDDEVLKRIAKGSTFADHVMAAEKARAADVTLSTIFLLGAGGTDRSDDHARASAALATAMDPAYLAALTLTVVPGTPLATLEASGRFTLPDVEGLLRELRTFVDLARPTNALFRTNHASNYLPLGGRLPEDREQILATIDQALAGGIALRPESLRAL